MWGQKKKTPSASRAIPVPSGGERSHKRNRPLFAGVALFKGPQKTALGLAARRIICRSTALSTYRRNYLIATVLPTFAKTMLIIGHLSTIKSAHSGAPPSVDLPDPYFLPCSCPVGSLNSRACPSDCLASRPSRWPELGCPGCRHGLRGWSSGSTRWMTGGWPGTLKLASERQGGLGWDRDGPEQPQLSTVAKYLVMKCSSPFGCRPSFRKVAGRPKTP